MAAKIIKRTIQQVTDSEGNITESVKAIEIAIVDGEVERGRVNVSEWGGNFNYDAPIAVEDVCNAIVNMLTGEV